MVSHDAGGAEIISAWLRASRREGVDYCIEGPAAKIFPRKIECLHTVPADQAMGALESYHEIVTGTSWPSEMERRFIREAKSRNVRVVTYLDHWVGYRERLTLNGLLVLPDELRVGDEFAFEMASNLFPTHPIVFQENLYFTQMAREISELSDKRSKVTTEKRVLYLTEPMSNPSTGIETDQDGTPRYRQYSEFEALRGYVDHLKKASESIERMRIRSHPSEKKGKYVGLAEGLSSNFPIEVDVETSLQEDCAWSDWVVGCQTMALVIALHAGKCVFSCIPPGGAPLTLPYPGIRRVFD